MSTNIKVPPLGDSVTEAVIAKWHVQPGQFVELDQLLVDLETDKITLEVNSPASGVLEAINYPQGATVEPNMILGAIKEGLSQTASTQTITPPVQQATVPAQNDKTVPASSSTPIASPAATKIANEQQIPLSSIAGSARGGVITKADVLNTAAKPVTQPTTSTQVSHTECCPTTGRVEERQKMSRLRQTIARRLKEAQNTAAILTTFNEIDMSKVMEIRKKYQDNFSEKHKTKLGFMSFFVKATVLALKEIPELNAQIENDEIIYKNYFDIGVAVGTENGVVVPVLRDAQNMSLAEIEKAITSFGIKAREGKLEMRDMTGGTFSITNGGIYGSLCSTPILNPPQSGILGMHKIQDRAVVVDGQIVVRPIMAVALSYDHRIVDGREAVTFLVMVKKMLENPEVILLDLL